MATSFITLILTLFHYSLPPPSCKVLHSSITVTLLSPSPGIFHSMGDVGGRRDSWGHKGSSSVAEWSQSPGCCWRTCWGNSQSLQWWHHPSCHCCCFPVTCKGTAPLMRPFPIRFFHPPSCSLVAGALQCRCLLSILSQPLPSAISTALATEGYVPGWFKIGKQAAMVYLAFSCNEEKWC